MNDNDPIKQSIQAALKLFGDERDVRAFVADESRQLEELGHYLTDQNGDERKAVVVLLYNKSQRKRDLSIEWKNLLRSVLCNTKSGVVCEPRNLLCEILRYERGYAKKIVCQRSPNYEIRPWAEIEEREDLRKLAESLRSWACLEAFTDPGYESVFARIAGGARPEIYVLDDYNNYICSADDDYRYFTPIPKDRISDRVYALYGGDVEGEPADQGKRELHQILSNHCGNLNNLAATYHVNAPALFFSGSTAPTYSDVADILPFEEMDLARDRIAAFLVDLEWKKPPRNGDDERNTEEVDWSGMGYRAIDLLSQRFPEVPCFVYTGQWEVAKLQEALAHGAQWCFFKESHHGSDLPDKSNQLAVLNLENHLTGAAKRCYGAFEEVPYADQLITTENRQVTNKLVESLRLTLPLERTTKGDSFLRILARLFPYGEKLVPVKVFESGKSKAEATFLVSPRRQDHRMATRFVKVAPWMNIFREHTAYRRVIEPRVNSHIAHVVGLPVAAGECGPDVPLGALMYSMAGLPESYEELMPLDSLLAQVKKEAIDAEDVIHGLTATLSEVLLPLYRGVPGSSTTQRRPLWAWLGEVLPPAFTGSVIPLDAPDEENVCELGTYRDTGLAERSQWILGGIDSRSLMVLAREPVNDGKQANSVRFSGFLLVEVQWDQWTGEAHVDLAHPDLGWRVRLRGDSDDIRRRFGALWLKKGIPVTLDAYMDKENLEYAKLKERVERAVLSTGLFAGNAGRLEEMDSSGAALASYSEINGISLPEDPFRLLSRDRDVPFWYTIEAKASAIHGDLNLHNIQFAGKAGPGWLIDFENSVDEGMTAFDLAKLEVEIWYHHVFPLLEAIACCTGDKSRACFQVLRGARQAIENETRVADTFISIARTNNDLRHAEDGLFAPAGRLLEIISCIRRFGEGELALTRREMSWARGCYFSVSVKFVKSDSPWSILMCFCSSAEELGNVAPRSADMRGLPTEIEWRQRNEQVIDSVLIAASNGLVDIDNFTLWVSETEHEANGPLDWTTTGTSERWDLASTGSITNITPLMGYLWLKVKAENEKRDDGQYSVVVPKISSRGRSCGTVDILESAGLVFPNDPDRIRQQCMENGGVLCRQHETLTPKDSELMSHRKGTNAMKNIGLVYSSIIAKKMAMGCTHAIVDVKVGRDSKILAPWMTARDAQSWLNLENQNLDSYPDTSGERSSQTTLLRKDMCDNFRKMLKARDGLGLKGTVSKPSEKGWIEQNCRSELRPLKKIRWFFTNADMPQCRAIGRQLILLHLDDIILGTYGDRLLEVDQYKELYTRFLPLICDFKPSGEDVWPRLKQQWCILKSSLTNWNSLTLFPFFEELYKVRENEKEEQVCHFLDPNNYEKDLRITDDVDLRVVTFCLDDYLAIVEGDRTLKGIDAWKLDGMFETLLRDVTFDADVGIYLHRVPGEIIRGGRGDPFLSVFYRASRTDYNVVTRWVRTLLTKHVELAD